MQIAVLAMWTGSLMQEASPASDGSGVITLVIFGIIAACLTWWAVVWSRREEALRAYFSAQKLQGLGNCLPASLKPPAIAWMPDYTVLDCFHGTRNGFEVAIFKIRIPQGESSYNRSMVAVRRTNFEPDVEIVREVTVSVDSSSTPEWIIASFKGGFRKPEILEDIVTALTAV